MPTVKVSRTTTTDDNVLLSFSQAYVEDDDRDMTKVTLLHGTRMSGPQWLQVLCAINSYTSAHIAEIVGVSVHTVDSWRQGRLRPSEDNQKTMRSLLVMPKDVKW